MTAMKMIQNLIPGKCCWHSKCTQYVGDRFYCINVTMLNPIAVIPRLPIRKRPPSEMLAHITDQLGNAICNTALSQQVSGNIFKALAAVANSCVAWASTWKSDKFDEDLLQTKVRIYPFSSRQVRPSGRAEPIREAPVHISCAAFGALWFGYLSARPPKGVSSLHIAGGSAPSGGRV